MKKRSLLCEAIEEAFEVNAVSLFLHTAKGERITYDEARVVIQTGVKKLEVYAQQLSSVVAVYAEKNIHSTLALYSIILNGKGYLPIDARSPVSRVVTILQEAKPSAILVQEKFTTVLEDALLKTEMEFSIVSFTEGFQLFLFADFKVYPEETLYVLFTSGSTGLPKGIIQTHKSAWAFLQFCLTINTKTQSENFISIAPYQFDLSIHDLFLPILNSGSLLLPDDLETSNSRLMAQIFGENKIETIYSTPSFFNWLMDTGRLERCNFLHVKLLLIAGEVLRWETVKRLQKYFPNAAMFNLYGPTETNVCMAYEVKLEDEQKYVHSVPIGKSCSYSTMKLVKREQGKELYIAGESLMQGYTHEDKTCFEQIDGDKFYATGDIVEEAFDGTYAFVSRGDRMIKRNGFRIEPAEIEAVLKKLVGVKQVAVIADKQNDSVKIYAFLVSEKKHETIFLKNFCADAIPYYMIPDRFVFVDEILLNANHKTDGKRMLALANQ